MKKIGIDSKSALKLERLSLLKNKSKASIAVEACEKFFGARCTPPLSEG
ncbi:MAG: hypothetical protein MJ249_15030 [Kiritimatiellae bacterium]|nr:hypothetical protein [Kiritimatiellia bacterium]